MKRIIILLSICLLITMFSFAVNAEFYGSLEYVISNNEVIITDCNPSATMSIIPTTINEYPVKHIGTDCFFSCNQLSSVVIPYGVESIGDYAFTVCSNLNAVTVPNTVVYLGAHAFRSCNSLVSATLSNNIENVNDYTFAQCNSLERITIPNGVKNIGNFSFSNCKSLTTVTMPESVISIGENAFLGCQKLTNIVVPNKVTSIGFMAFASCTNLVSVELPSSITSISEYVFNYCISLKDVTIPNSILTIEQGAFIQCTNLESIIIPSSVISIGNYAFAECEKIESIIIPNSVTSIGESVFRNCPNLTIYGYADSTAETYAMDNDIPFIALDNTKILGKSLYLDGGIGVKLHFEYDSEVVSPESLVFNVALTNSSDNSVTEKEASLTLDADTNTAYTIVYVPAKDINTVSISGKLTGKTVSGNVLTFEEISGITVPQYIEELERLAQIYAPMKASLELAKTMETYCFCADAYFNNTEIEDITLTDAEESEISKIVHPSITNQTLGNIEFYSTSLLLEGTVTLRHYFKVTGDIDPTDYVVEGGSELTLSDSSVGYAYIDIENISANELGVQKTVKITNNGETTEIVFSPLNYVKLAYNDDDTALKNLVKAFYRYSVKATEYA